MITGSCLCATVKFAVDHPFDRMLHCHCSMCRKLHGAAFATYGIGPAQGLRWLEGEDAIRRYESSPGFIRAFCGHCGSALPGLRGERVIVPVANLDGDANVNPTCHIFAGSKAPWHSIGDALTCYDERPGGDALAPEPVAVPRGEQPRVLEGGCQCGAVHFQVVEPFIRAHNCHCSRCRKGRSAAHASNAFTSVDGVRFTRGEDNITLYRLPAAKFFSIAFCKSCGSGVPRLDPERKIAVIPMGALDDDPKRGVDSNIFTADAPAWYPAVGDIPAFDGPPA